MKSIIVFVAACIIGRNYRKLMSWLKPDRPRPEVARADAMLDVLQTHEIAALLAVRLKRDQLEELKRLEDAALAVKLRAVLDPETPAPKA